jgi:hypothetical protein
LLLLLWLQDIGQDPSNPLTRLYATHAAQPFHNDSADIVTLLCLRNAKSGTCGLSLLVKHILVCAV